eukprot:jgi/Tetstr1/436371/TSEL_025204.t1
MDFQRAKIKALKVKYPGDYHAKASTGAVLAAFEDDNTAALTDQPSDDTDAGDELTLEEEEMLLSGLAKNGPTATEADRIFAELAHAKFCIPRRIAMPGQLDQLRRAFDDKTLEISLSAAGKAPAAAVFAKATPDKPTPTECAAERRKQRKQAAAARKAAATAAAAAKAKANATK